MPACWASWSEIYLLAAAFEGWTYQRIMQELGPIEYYVHDRAGRAAWWSTDDDVAGTLHLCPGAGDYGIKPDLSAEEIGKAWLNYLRRTALGCCGGAGNGNSTEHTAW